MNRTIHTNLYSDKTYSLIRNFAKISSYNHPGKIARSLANIIIDRAPDNEILIVIKDIDNWTYRYNIFYIRETDVKALDWIAWMIKDCAFNCCRRIGLDFSANWNRMSDRIFTVDDRTNPDSCIKFIVKDAYCLYDILKNRKNIKNKYSSDVIDGIKGEQRDPIATELEIARREEYVRIITKYQELTKKLDSEYWKRINEAKKSISEWKNAEAKKLTQAKDKELEELNKMTTM